MKIPVMKGLARVVVKVRVGVVDVVDDGVAQQSTVVAESLSMQRLVLGFGVARAIGSYPELMIELAGVTAPLAALPSEMTYIAPVSRLETKRSLYPGSM
jgi:hypothetical protein